MSKIPEGATHTYAESTGTTYRKNVEGSWFGYADGDWVCVVNPASSRYEPIQADTEWTGEGLPSVGVICELWVRDDLWASCQVIAMDEQDGQPVSVVRYGGGYYAGTNKCLRPIRTAEQIAAEEREKAVNEMVSSLGRFNSIYEACGMLYDENYRKRVGK